MRRFIVRALMILIALVVLAAAVGPFLVDPNPAVGATDARDLAEPGSRFLELETDGGPTLRMHYLQQAPA